MLLIKLSSPEDNKEIILLPILGFNYPYLFNAALVVGGDYYEKWKNDKS